MAATDSFEAQLLAYHIHELSTTSEEFSKQGSNPTELTFTNIVIQPDNEGDQQTPSFFVTGDEAETQIRIGNSFSNENVRGIKLPSDIAECLATSRRLLYLSLRNLLLKCTHSLEDMVTGFQSTIPDGCEWVLSHWRTHPLDAGYDWIVRAKLFSTLKSMFGLIASLHPPPANRDALQAVLRATIELQSITDLASALFLEVDVQFSDVEVWSAAWKAFALEEEGIMEYFGGGCHERMMESNFMPPSASDEARLSRLIKHPFSSVTVIRILIHELESCASLNQKASLATHGKPTVFRNSVRVDSGKVARVCLSKLQWFILFLTRYGTCFSAMNAKVAVVVCTDICNMVDPLKENEPWQMMCGNFLGILSMVIDKNNLSLDPEESPPLTCNNEIPPSNVLAAKQNEQSSTEAPGLLIGSVTSIKNFSGNVFVDSMNVIAGLEEIRFQVDPFSERIVLKPSTNAIEPPNEEMLTSRTSGTLVLTRKEIIWSLAAIDFSNPNGFTYQKNNSFRIRHSAITRFSAVALKLAPVPVAPTLNQRPSFASHRKNSFVSLMGASASILNLVGRDSGGAQQRSRVGSFIENSKMYLNDLIRGKDDKPEENAGRKAYACVIHTRNEAFKLYPFYDEEVTQMMQTLRSVTGLSPFKSHEFVQTVLLIVDMERLFHSCKMENEVTKEAMAMLRKEWHHTQSDQTRMKILSVLDRILDRVILRQEDPAFTTMFKWLKHLEETMNPYRNPELLKLVVYLVKRAKIIQIEPLAPLPNDQRESLFDNYQEFEFLMQFSAAFGVSLNSVDE
ncbi:hypothetical protein HDU98_009187 [Podochytrium sp. JEL0797]|nr:hypothetical protein HDU98_009187 [Podochytrium sp. JEL0797]